MALPSKKQQVEAVAKFLDSERNEGRSLEEIATDVVDGFLKAITPPSPAIHLREGMLIKSILSAKVHRVAWIGGEVLRSVWVVPESGGYGWLGPYNHTIWQFSEEYRPKRRVEVDGKGKMLEMTDEQIAEAWDNADWKVGDLLSQHQREFKFEVIAVGPTCALLRNTESNVLTADSNGNLKKYYRRESKVDSEW